MITLILVFLVISILILVHEWGHFYAARKLGVKVEEFGFGFPPRIFARVKNGVRYSFNLLPFGGFVKIFGEHGEGENNTESFASRPARQRFLILAAGVGMNLLLAWVFFSAGAAIGLPKIAEGDENIPVSIIAVIPGSPAHNSGLKVGDKILEMRASPPAGGFSLRIEKEEDIRDFADAYRGEEVILAVKRGEEILELKAVPRKDAPEGEGPLGIALARLTLKKTPLLLSPLEGAKTLAFSIGAVGYGLAAIIGNLITEGSAGAAVSGPVGIFFFAEDSRALGIAYFLQFAGLLSVNLAILNFLPIPALDGGRALFLVFEKIKGKRVNPHLENVFHTVGFVLLVLLMLLVTYKDIARLF